jgi:hypothetical protein
MSQHDLVIDNQSHSSFRADVNDALAAIKSLNSGPAAPPNPVAGMMWLDTTTNTINQRNSLNNAWIPLYDIDLGIAGLFQQYGLGVNSQASPPSNDGRTHTLSQFTRWDSASIDRPFSKNAAGVTLQYNSANTFQFGLLSDGQFCTRKGITGGSFDDWQVLSRVNTISYYCASETGTGSVFTLAPTNNITFPSVLPNGMKVAFHVDGSPSSLNTPITLQLTHGGNTNSYPLVYKGQVVQLSDVVNFEYIEAVFRSGAFHRLKTSSLPQGIIEVPTPIYVDGANIAMNGAMAVKERRGQVDIEAPDALRTINMNNANSLNGRAETGSVVNNAWYYEYALMNASGSNIGYVMSLDEDATTFTLGGTPYPNVRRLPLAVKTNASGSILPFVVASWRGRQAEVQYVTNLFKSTPQGGAAPSANTTVVDAERPSTQHPSLSFSTVDASAFIPIGAKYARFDIACSSSVAVRLKHENGAVWETFVSGQAYACTDVGISPLMQLSDARTYEVQNFSGGGNITTMVHSWLMNVS